MSSCPAQLAANNVLKFGKRYQFLFENQTFDRHQGINRIGQANQRNPGRIVFGAAGCVVFGFFNTAFQ